MNSPGTDSHPECKPHAKPVFRFLRFHVANLLLRSSWKRGCGTLYFLTFPMNSQGLIPVLNGYPVPIRVFRFLEIGTSFRGWGWVVGDFLCCLVSEPPWHNHTEWSIAG